MRLAHLILTHAQPEQLARLVKRLEHKNTHFFIHLDLKTPIESFRFLENNKRVSFIKNRVKVYWGGYSIVQATVNALKEILSSGHRFDYINLLSGQDYPIKSTEFIHKFLSDHPGKAFMHSLSVHNEWHEAIPRITMYHLANARFPGKYRMEKLINRTMPVRKFPQSMEPVGRSQWFTMSPDCAVYIVDFLNKHTSFRRFFKLSWAPDEMIFQTILYNSHFRSAMVNDNLLYVDWSAGKPNPKVMTMEDADALKKSDKLFARKFSPAVDSEILDYLDKLAVSKR